MPKNMSFALTLRQFKDRSKTVTRRFGWNFLKAGQIVCGVEKGQGIKKGQLKRIGMIRIISIRNEMLCEITPSDCAKEGFPEMTPEDFTLMLCKYSGHNREQRVNRIEFEHINSKENSHGAY